MADLIWLDIFLKLHSLSQSARDVNCLKHLLIIKFIKVSLVVEIMLVSNNLVNE